MKLQTLDHIRQILMVWWYV